MSDTESQSSQVFHGANPVPSSATPADGLNDHQKDTIRAAILNSARLLLNVSYGYGAEWTDYNKIPEALDCSELAEGVYRINGLKMPDGSQNQFDFCVHAPEPKPGDLAFFGRGGNPKQIYHVGMLIDNHTIIEARGFEPKASFVTGRVILRPLARWTAYQNFVDFMVHPKLL